MGSPDFHFRALEWTYVGVFRFQVSTRVTCSVQHIGYTAYSSAFYSMSDLGGSAAAREGGAISSSRGAAMSRGTFLFKLLTCGTVCTSLFYRQRSRREFFLLGVGFGWQLSST